MRILCFFGWHMRSRGQAKFDGHTFVSVCKRCNHPMIKDDHDVWRVSRSD